MSGHALDASARSPTGPGAQSPRTNVPAVPAIAGATCPICIAQFGRSSRRNSACPPRATTTRTQPPPQSRDHHGLDRAQAVLHLIQDDRGSGLETSSVTSSPCACRGERTARWDSGQVGRHHCDRGGCQDEACLGTCVVWWCREGRPSESRHRRTHVRESGKRAIAMNNMTERQANLAGVRTIQPGREVLDPSRSPAQPSRFACEEPA